MPGELPSLWGKGRRDTMGPQVPKGAKGAIV